MINKDYVIEINHRIVDIKYYLKIINYSLTNICVKTSSCIINLYGVDLMINKLDEFELSIIGKINKIEFANE